MAKSVKQQMYEQLANQHVQQALNNIGMQQFQDAYNAWNAEQNGLANFQAAYNEWNDANPVQTPQVAQQIPTLAKPQNNAKKNDYIQDKIGRRKAALLNSPAYQREKIQQNIDTEDYFRQQQEEQALAERPRTKEEDRKQIQKNYNTEEYFKQQQEEQMQAEKGIDWERFLNNKFPREKQVTTEKDVATIPDEVLQQYAEKKGVSIEEARRDFEKAEAMKNQSIEAPEAIDTEATTAAHGAWLEDQRRANQRQQTNYESFLNGMGNAVTAPISGPIRLAGAVTGNNLDPVPERSREEYRNAMEQNPISTMGGNLAGMLLLGKAINAGGAESASAGNVMKAAQEDAILNGATKTEAARHGIEVGIRQLLKNTATQMPFDLATDIIPTLANDIAEGKTTWEIAANTLLNIIINGGFNAAGDVVSMAKTAKTGLPTLKPAIGQPDLPKITNEDELVGDINKQFSNFMADYQPTFKDESAMRNVFTPEDLDNIQNAQFRQLMEENLIPERLNPVAEMEMPEDVLGADEIKALSNEYGNMWGSADVPKLAQPETPKADIPQVEPPKVDNTGVRPRAADQGVSPAIENEAEALAKQMDAEEVAKPKFTLDTETEDKLDYDFSVINDSYYKNMKPLKKSLEERDFSIHDAVINTYTDKNGKTVYELIHNESQKPIKSFKTQKAAEKALAEYQEGSALKERAIKAFDDIDRALYKYEVAAYQAEDIAEVNTYKRAAEAARKRYERAMKELDPDYHDSISGKDFADKIAQPYYTRNPQAEGNSISEEDMDDIINDWIENDRRKREKYYLKNSETQGNGTAASGQSNPGQYKMQYFADGNAPREKWATSKLRTNSMEKTGLIKDPNDIPVHEYDYRVYSGAEQRLDFADRYKDSDDIVRDLYEKDAFDEVDMRGAGQTWRDLMKSGDINNVRRANKLGHKMEIEGREGGRLIEAVKEMNRDTPEGQLQEAQEVIGKAIDKRVGKGTTEALNNLYDDILDAFEKSKDKDEFAKKVESLLTGDLKQHVSPKTAKTMKSKQIQGKAKIMKMLDKGESLDDVSFDELIDALYKSNGSVTLSPKAQVEIYDLLNQATQYAPDSYEFRKLQAKAARKVMAEVPSGLGDHVRAFLYDNMLGNFKTAFSRNFLGNVAYQSLEKVRELPTALVDKGVSLVTHKRSALGWNKDKASSYLKGFGKGTKESALDFANSVNTNRSGQNTFAEALKNNTTVHNDAKKIGHLLNQVDFYVESAMKFGDRNIYEANYAEFKTELEQLLARYGKNGVAGLENVEDKYIPETIDNLAKVRAADAVFQKQGKMSEGLTKLRDGLGDLSKGAFGVDILSTASTPFTLTPGNMLERAIEYTPLGFVKNGIQTGIEAYNKSFDQRRFAEQAGRSLLGLPVLWGAYQGAKKGLISGGYSTDPDERAAQQEDGFIEYGLNVPDNVPVLGGKTLDTSDLPVYGPFMQVGSVISEQGLSPQSSLQAAEAVAGGSTLQGIRRAFGADNASYSSQNGIVENLKNTVLSSGSQVVPSLVRQTAQTTDEYKRDLGEYGTNEYYLNLVKNNIPGVRQTLPIKTDVEGEPVLQNQGRGLGSKILENYVLPMNMSEYEPSELNVEASRLRQSTGDAFGFAPKAKRSELRSWDEAEKVEYSEEQFREYKQQLGEMNSEMGTTLINSDFYKGLDDTQKNKALQDSYSAMKAVLKKNMVGKDTDDKLAKAYMEGGVDAVINELEDKYALDSAGLKDTGNARAALDGLGEDGLKVYAEIKESLDGSTSAENIQNELNKRNMSNADKAKYYSYLATDASPGANPYDYVPGVNYNPEKDDSYQKAKAVIPTLDPVNYYKTKDTIDGIEDANNSITQSELIAYITRQNMSDAQAQQYWKAFGGWKNKKGELKKLVKQDGKWVSTY